MDSLKKGWFSELDTTLWPGQCFSLECDKLLYSGKSKYQDVLVFNKLAFSFYYNNYLCFEYTQICS
jgi:spermidine synthase